MARTESQNAAGHAGVKQNFSPVAVDLAVGPTMAMIPQAPHHQYKRSFHVYLPRWSFCLAWWLIVAFHVVLGGFCVSAAMLNHSLQQGTMLSFFGLLPFGIMKMTAVSFWMVGCGHVFATTHIVWHSVKARQLTLHSMDTAVKVAVEGASPPPANLSQAWQAICRSCCAFVRLLQANRVYGTLTAVWCKYFSMDGGLFGLNGEYFESAFKVREAVEIALQTYQAYQLSFYTPRVWINQLAVGVIVLNCFSSALVHVFFHGKTVGVRHVVHVVHDSVLDFTCSVVIPFAIAMPYVLLFDPATGAFPLELMVNDVWYVNAKSEIYQVLVTSYIDFVSTVMPQLCLLSCLLTLKSVLRRNSTRVGNAVVAASAKEWNPAARRRAFPDRCWRPNKAVVVHAVFMVWGLVVLGLHLEASRTTDTRVQGCQLYVGAWHSSGLACSVMNLNCHMHQIQGSTNETTAVLDQLDRNTLRVLVYSHCPALHIPRVVTDFPRLLMMELFNCSLVDWPEEAALQHARQPMFGYLYMVLTNWTNFPVGILHDQLPLGMEQITIVGTNLTQLPATLGDSWSNQRWTFVAIDRAPSLRVLPTSFCKLSIQIISLASTNIQTLPDPCFQDTLALVLSGSPVQKLTASMAGSLIYIEAEHTPLTELPGYLDTLLRDQQQQQPALTAEEAAAKLFGSALCDTPPAMDTSRAYGRAYCGTDFHTTEGSYGWQYMLPQRQFEQ